MTNRKRKGKGGEPLRTCAWVVLLLVFVAELMAYTWCRVQYVKIGYELSQVTERHAALVTVQNNLKVELARLKSPARIEKIARDKLGLVSPTPGQVITLP